MSLKDLRSNPIMLTDSYNLSHQFLKINTDYEVSHIYNRAKWMIFAGFTEIVNSVLKTQINMDMVDEAEFHANRKNLTFPRKIWEGVVKECNGYVPLWIQAVPEGTYCPAGTPFVQIRNTVEGYGELVTWFEGEFMHGYFPSTCATQAYRMRKYLEQKQRQYGYDDIFMWRFHSFGFRGHKSLEDAYWASKYWNMFLNGTDDFHSAKHTPSAQIGSIMALAHKVTQQFDDEYECFKHAIDATKEHGKNIVALVIDTYDANRVINEYVKPLADYAKDQGVHLVFRPDSGDTWLQAVEIYRVAKRNNLTNVSVIIGEGMDFENAKKADAYFESHNVPLNFINYGIGGGFYNYMNRETLGWAMKTAYSNGAPRMKFSMNPIKRSIPDTVALYKHDNGDLVVHSEKDECAGLGFVMYDTVYYHDYGIYKPLFKDVGDSLWLETRKRALEQNTEQPMIYLSKNIQEKIQGFIDIYRDGVQ